MLRWISYDTEGIGQHTDKKRLKKIKDMEEIDKDMENIVIDLTRRNQKSPEPMKKSVQKSTYTSDNLDDFKVKLICFLCLKGKSLEIEIKEKETQKIDQSNLKLIFEDLKQLSLLVKSLFLIQDSKQYFKGEEKKREISPMPKKEAPRKGKTTMEIEDDGNGTDVTEVISDDDRDSFDGGRSKTPKKNVKEEKKESLRDIANKARQNKSVTRKPPSDDEDEDEDRGAKGKKGKTSAKKGKAQDTTIQGPFSGNTIVLTGVMVDMSRDNMTDLLKMLGA